MQPLKGDRKQMTVYVSEEAYFKVRQKAAEQGISASKFVEELIAAVTHCEKPPLRRFKPLGEYKH